MSVQIIQYNLQSQFFQKKPKKGLNLKVCQNSHFFLNFQWSHSPYINK